MLPKPCFENIKNGFVFLEYCRKRNKN